MTLQELCLETIVESFERFYRVYSAMDNELLQKEFRIIQRFYSRELVKRLYKKGLLQEKYADLLFNKSDPYEKSSTPLRTKWISTFSWETIVAIFARIGANLEKVSFDEFDPSGVPWKDIVCYLPNVKSVKYKNYCNNDILRCIAECCRRLESLDVTHSDEVTDDGVEYFFHMEEGKENRKERLPCPQLKEIFVENTLVTHYGVEKLLKNIPSLEKIDHRNLGMALHEIHRNDLWYGRAGRYHLTYLNLLIFDIDNNINVYDEVLKACVTVCPNLKSFECFVFKLEHVNLCAMLPELEKLSLWRMGDSSIDISDFLRENGEKLTSLTLYGCKFSLSALEHSCIHLNELTVRKVIIQYKNDNIPRFDNLKELHVEEVDLSDSGNYKSIGRILRSSPVLHRLIFVSCRILTSEVKTEILKGCEQCALTWIDFCFCPVEEKFFEDILLTCCMLERLDLTKCYISTESEESLRRLAESLPNRPKIRIFFRIAC